VFEELGVVLDRLLVEREVAVPLAEGVDAPVDLAPGANADRHGSVKESAAG
jgi:hypothetical protein